MSMRSFLFFILLIRFFPAGAFDFRFTNISVLQGLSSGAASCIYTDNRGFTWIGTATGLNRFDGEKFTIYSHHRNDSNSLPADNIHSIAGDSSGMLWIATENGVAKFNPWNGKCKTIAPVYSQGAYPSPFTNIFIDQSHSVWAVSLAAVWKYDENKNAFVVALRCDGKDNHPERCTNFYQDKEGRYWICSYNGLFRFYPENGKTEQYKINVSVEKENLLVCIFQDHYGRLWCGSWGNGFAEFLPEEKKFITSKWIEKPEYPSASNIVLAYTETFADNKYILWAATNAGLAAMQEINTDNFNFSFSKHDPSNAESISSNQVFAVAVNASGQLWSGTSGGVSILLPERQLFQEYAPGFKGQVTHIVPEKNGDNFFCSWYGNGLQEISKEGIVTRYWKSIPENNTDCEQVSDVVRAGDGTLWVATFGGLSHGDAQGNNFRQVLPETNNPNSICDKRIVCLAEDLEGNIWCGSYGKGISVINPITNACVNYKSDSHDPHSLPYDLVWTILCRKNGEVWIGTNAGLCRYDAIKKRFDSWKYILRGNDILNIGVSHTLYEDSKGVLWIGTDNGLFFLRKDNTFGAWLKEDGLADNFVYGIHEDQSGNIWISTGNGLSKLNPANGKFTNFSAGSGLPVSDLSGDLGSTSDGKILIGLDNRVIGFYPELLNRSTHARIFITGISVSGKDLDFDKEPSAFHETEFPWNDNVISFDFVSPGIRGIKSVSYEFQLNGADKKWVNAEGRHFASYVGLPPGTYVFRCRVSVNNGEWSEPAAFSFIIHPPFWKRWWFIIAVTLIILTLIILVVRRESTRKFREKLLILEKKQAVEMERNRISRDMHDDLGSGLTKIAILSEVVKRKINPADDSQKQINTISESARELVDNLNEIIWALNPDNDHLSNLAAYIREYANRFLEPFGIDAHCSVPEELNEHPLSEETRRNIFLVLKEALHNIVKHANATSVEIIFRQNGNFSMEIKDNGKGFLQEETREFGNGLKSMKKRAEAIGATFSFSSAPEKGTSVKIELVV
ncbi:MAG: two-component regulator propeller domain-containing protein [Bacteroidia bacterium]